ncbi:MAG: ribokinase [Fimbriimonas sp.]
MRKHRVNVVGSANMDLVVRTTRFPLPGETILGGEFSTFPGGKGANQAVAIAKLGGHPLFIGKVGADPFGHELSLSLGRSGVDITELIVSEDHPTGIAVITVDGAGENTIVVASGANMALSPEEVDMLVTDNPSSVLLAQLEIPLKSVIQAGRAHHGIFILNPAPARILPKELLAMVDVITPNEHETEQLTGIAPQDETSCRLAAEALLERGVKNVIITLGSAGCYLKGKAGEGSFKAFGVDAMDTTAAGDAFSGGLAHALSSGKELKEAITFASAVAALSTTRFGAQSSMPTLAEAKAFLQV